jgi:hypothetical protein
MAANDNHHGRIILPGSDTSRNNAPVWLVAMMIALAVGIAFSPLQSFQEVVGYAALVMGRACGLN